MMYVAMKRLAIFFLLGIFSSQLGFADNLSVPIGTLSVPTDSEISIQLVKRFQYYNAHPENPDDHYDQSINSPKSVAVLDSKKKFYVNSLEGCSTSVYCIVNCLTSFNNCKLLFIVNNKKD